MDDRLMSTILAALAACLLLIDWTCKRLAKVSDALKEPD
jgi:hypothetical protein